MCYYIFVKVVKKRASYCNGVIILIGERIQYIRKYYDETQQELADAIHMSVHTVRYWEQERGAITVEALLEICKHYKVSSDYLLGLVDEEPSLVKKQHELLTQENKTLLRRFEAFLVSEQKRKNKNSR